MSRLLILVHGMGHHPDGWEQSPLDVLRECADAYGVRERFDSMVTPHAISYDSVFREKLEGWEGSVGELRGVLESAGTGGFSIPSWLEGISEVEKNFFWSHVVDVALYRFVPQVFIEVRTRVMRDFVEAVNAAGAGGSPPNVSVLAYSLGTSVAHDALAHLTMEPIEGSHAYVAANGWRLDNLFMVANVSRVLNRLTVPFYQSSVRCEFAPGGGDAGIRRYASFRHSLDPIPAVRPFAPAGWGSRFMTVSVDHLLDWNVHDLDHHLRHPNVHIPILNRLLDFPITPQQHRDAVAALEEVGRDRCVEIADRLRMELRQARDLVALMDDPVALVRVATQIHGLIEQARADCRRAGGN